MTGAQARAVTVETTSDQGNLRLTMKPVGSTSGYVDGAWWPRSTDLADEVPDLLVALTARLGRVERVSYDLAAWSPAGRRVEAAGVRVRLDGFRTRPSGTVDVSGVDDHRVTLLVIPPGTDESTARATMRRACKPGNIETPSSLLAGTEADAV